MYILSVEPIYRRNTSGTDVQKFYTVLGVRWKVYRCEGCENINTQYQVLRLKRISKTQKRY